MDRVVIFSPVHRHILIVVLFTKHRFDGLLVSSITHSLDRALKLIALVGRQGDDDGVFLGASELRRVIVRIVEDRMKEFLLAHCTTIVLLVVQVTSTVSGETPHRFANVRLMARR